jgi:rRNA-processing protein FCF1
MAADRNGSTRRVKVLLDTNALMMPAQFRIDLFGEISRLVGEFTPIVPVDVLNELRGLSTGCGRESAAARFGLTLAEQCTSVERERSDQSVDEQIINYALREGCVVVTNDRALRKALNSRGIAVISMKKQKILDIIRS